MRPLRALRHAMRTRRTDRIGLAQADRLVAGDQPGPRHRGLGDLLAAASAPARDEELAGEQAAVAAFAAAQPRAAAPKGRTRARVARSTRTVVVTITAGLALLAISGTALAARTGNLPDGAQQHAHRLFSALGVPAPGTGAGVQPGKKGSRPSASSGPAPSASRTTIAADISLGWCRAWQGASTGPSADPGLRRRLAAVAGGDENIARYCARLTRSSAPPASSRAPSSTAPTSPAPTRTAPTATAPRSDGTPVTPSATTVKPQAEPGRRGQPSSAPNVPR